MYLDRLFIVLGEERLAQAQRLFGLGKYAECLKELRPFLDSTTEAAGRELAILYSTKCHIEIGRGCEEKGEISLAIDEYLKALKLNPTYADLYNRLGLLREKKGEYGRGIAEFIKAIEINPDYVEAHINLASIMARAGMVEEARRNLEETARRLEIPAMMVEGMKLREGLKGGISKPKAKGRSSEKGRKCLLDGILLLSQGENQAAIEKLKEAITENPGYADVENLLGIAYGNEGMLDDAIEAFERAVRINRSFVAARINLSIALMRRGLGKEAKVELETVLRIDPSNAIARNLLSVRTA